MRILRSPRKRILLAGLVGAACLACPTATPAQTNSTPLPQPPQVVIGPAAAPAATPATSDLPATSPAAIALQPAAPPAPVDPEKAKFLAIIKEYEAEKKKAEDAKKAADDAKGIEIVNNLPMTAVYNNGLQLQAANKAFWIRIGGYMQFDQARWAQPANTLPPNPNNVGVLDNGVFFRRVRVELEGTIWETMEFQFYPAFEGVNRLLFDEMWVGVKDLPILGTVRIGKDKIYQGMDSIGSSKDVWFMERSLMFETFEFEYGLGIFQTTNIFGDRGTLSSSVHREDLSEFAGNEGFNFDNGGYAGSVRVTGLPIYEADGRYLVHVGASWHGREANLDRSLNVFFPAPAAATIASGNNSRFVRFRSRPDLRDAVGIGTLTGGGGAGNTIIGYNEGDGTRFVDTGLLRATDVHTFATEFYTVWGRFSLLNEQTFAIVGNAATTAGVPLGTQYFWGSSTQVSCFLTGENRLYNKRMGTYGRVIPNTNAWLVKDEDGAWNSGLGAWEVCYRYGFEDLNVTGAVVGSSGFGHSHTVGVNWHLNPNCRLMFNYNLFSRSLENPASNGMIHGFGTRVHLQF